MADNVVLNAGSGGVTLAADDITSVWYQRVKLTDGTADSATPINVANGVHGNALRVTIASDSTGQVKLAAGTAAIGKLAANSGVDIGDVDITSLIPGTGATNLGKAEDAVHSSGDTGILALAVRRAADTPTSGADGDYEPLKTDANGHLKVEIFDGGDTLTVSGTVTANLSATDNAVLDSIDTAVNGTLTVGSHAVTNAGTFAVQISDTSFAVADGNALGEGVLIQGDDGTDRKNINVDATTGDVQVDITHTVTVDGSGVTQPVSGTVTANLSATDNAVLDSIDTAVNLIDDPVFADDAAFTLASSKVSMAGAIRDDSLATLTAVEGDAVPLRVGATGALHVTGGGGGTEYTEDVATANPIVGTATMMERDDVLSTLTPVAGDWAAFRCSAEGALWVQDFNSDTIAGAVSGSEMQVDVVAALPAGTNAIGKLAANSGVDIGDVDILSVTPGTAAANLGKAEDAAHSSGDTGVMSLAVRNDTLAALAGTDGDYAPVQVNALGAVFTQDAPNSAGGLTVSRQIDVDETEDEISSVACQVYWISAQAIDATPLYLHLYNATAANVTVGTTTPLITFIVPSQGDGNGAGLVTNIDKGIPFGTALSIAATTTVGGTTGPGTNECIVNIGYKA